jgi:acyl-CoA thioester hydrolase
MTELKPYTHRVQYYETDMMGLTHHSNYVRWMEEARIDFLDRLGFPYKAMEAAGILSPVTKISCEYKRPSSFGDLIEIRVSVSAFNGVVLAIQYVMSAEDGSVVCTASSEHVFLSKDGRFVRMKKEMPELSALLAELAAAGEGPMPAETEAASPEGSEDQGSDSPDEGELSR